MKRLTLLTLVAVAACNGETTTRVRLDLSPLHQHAAQTAQSFASAELVVTTAEGKTLVSEELDPTALTFDVEVPSGPARAFTVEAWNPGTPERLTVYWGAVTEDLAPRTTIDLTLPVGAAGRVVGTVELAGGPPVPSGVELTFEALDPRPPLPATAVAPVVDGAFSLPLPVGRWSVRASVTVGEATFRLADGEQLSVVQAELNGPYRLVMESPSVPTEATVVIADSAGTPQVGAVVVVQNAAGDVAVETTTDAAGQAVVPVDDGDMITTLDDTDPMGYVTHLYTAVGVTRGDTVRFLFGGILPPATTVGSIDVTASGAPANSDYLRVSAGQCSAFPAAGAAGTMIVYDNCLGADGMLDMLGVATDANGAVAGYATAFDVDPSVTTLDLATWDAAPPSLAVTVPGLQTNDAVSLSLIPHRDAFSFYVGTGSTADINTPVPDPLPYPAGFAEYIDLSAFVYVQSSVGERRILRRFLPGSIPATTELDLASLVLPDITDIVADTITSPSRPIVSWTTAASPTQYDAAVVELSWYDVSTLTWSLLIPPTATTSIQYPSLPSSLSAVDPVNWSMAPTAYAEIIDADLADTYRSFLTTAGPAVLNPDAEDPALILEMTVSVSTSQPPG